MSHPPGAVPHPHGWRDILNRNLTAVSEHELPLGNTSQNRDFPLLPQPGVDAVFFDGDAEHAARGLAVEVFAVAEGCQGGCFSGEPGDDASFNRGVVGDDESASGAGDERCPDQLGQRVWHRVVEQFKGVEVALPGEGAGLVEVGQVVTGQVLDLDEASGEPSGASRSIELDKAACPTVRACDVMHRLVLLHRGFCEIAAQLQHFTHHAGGGVEGGLDVGFCEGR